MNQQYRVFAPAIDAVRRGPSGEVLPNLTVARPGNARRGAFTDSDEAPTLGEFDEFCQGDVALLVAAGAIVPYTPPSAVTPPAAEGVPDPLFLADVPLVGTRKERARE